jgi:hypothetical protein
MTTTQELQDELEKCLDTIQTHPSCQQTRQTLYNICKNILNNPNDQKFRKIRASVQKFQERIVQVNGALDFLLHCGFEIHPNTVSDIVVMNENTVNAYLILGNNHFDEVVLRIAETMLKVYPISIEVILHVYHSNLTSFHVLIDCFTTIDQLKNKIIEICPIQLPHEHELKFELMKRRYREEDDTEYEEYEVLTDDYYDERLFTRRSARQIGLTINSKIRIRSAYHEIEDNDDDEEEEEEDQEDGYQSFEADDSAETSDHSTDGYQQQQFQQPKHHMNNNTKLLENKVKKYKSKIEELNRQLYDSDKQHKRSFDKAAQQLQLKLLQQEIENKKQKQYISKLEKQMELLRGNTDQLHKLSITELIDLQKDVEQSRTRIQSCIENKWIEIDESICCVVCRDVRKSILFTPCNHLCVCEECSSHCRTCPLCRSHIQNRVKVFMYS